MRKSNQDSYFTDILFDNTVIAVVCDGMGGANAGNIASENASKVIGAYIKKSYRNELNKYELESLLKNAITSANNLLSALIDNHIYNGNELGLDKVVWKRCVDLNDRALRNVIVKYDNKGNLHIKGTYEHLTNRISNNGVTVLTFETVAVFCRRQPPRHTFYTGSRGAFCGR